MPLQNDNYYLIQDADGKQISLGEIAAEVVSQQKVLDNEPVFIPLLDENDDPVLDANGDPVLVPDMENVTLKTVEDIIAERAVILGLGAHTIKTATVRESEQDYLDLTALSVWSEIRADRDALLSMSDWTQAGDTPLDAPTVALWVTYRQTLRDIPTTQAAVVELSAVVWPAKP